ncbi:hypothetical protein [Streptomyces sp. NPDC049949]|uniref:VMAP-C domain-containing protein n=1 Tax=Streptomyces sp. NPDC049949 TaxID=3154627 RepID=UPI003435C14C
MDPRRLTLIRGGTVGQRRSVGSGYLIAPRLVLTARHVLVNANTGEFWPEIRVSVGHPSDGDTVPAKAELLWDHPEGLDVALLLTEHAVDVPGTVRWGRPAGTAPLPYEGLGFPLAAAGDARDAEHLRGILPPLSGSRDLYVLDQDPEPASRVDGRKAWGGASGAAVFCNDHLVGVVVRDDQSYGNRRLRALPVRAFFEDSGFVGRFQEYADGPPGLIEIGATLPKPRPAGERTPAEQELAMLLTPLLADPSTRSAHARALVRELGYEVPAAYEPAIPELSALLASHPRALASLSGTLAAACGDETTRARLTTLLVHAKYLGCGSLLSMSEHERLLDLLRGLCKEHPTLLPRAAREALRYTVLPEGLTRPHLADDDLDDVIGELEALSDSESVPEGTPPVPALLRLVEYVAAASGAEVAAKLRSWSRVTADRIGIHPFALRERRTDADRWAAREPSPVLRVVMELKRDDVAGEERYRCRILLARLDGSHSVLHEAETVAKTPQEAAGCLRDAVLAAGEEHGQGDHAPWVTVVVDRDGLHLAVDEWDPGAPNDFIPEQPIGAEYRVTLSCPELTDYAPQRERDQKRRWKSGHTAAFVTDETCGNRLQLRQLLQAGHRDAAWVVLHGPADQRESWLLICLALGVPVVLWDRDAAGYEDAARLQKLDPVGRLDGLPERVRVFRGDSFAFPGEQSARPSLVWEQDGHYPKPESLQLRDPWKGTHAS